MNKIIMGAAVLVSSFALLFAGTASAWYAELNGSVECNTLTGEWIVTWTLTNPENEIMTVQEASGPAFVPGWTVDPLTTETYQDSVKDSTTLTQIVRVNWPSDKKLRAYSATVTTGESCDEIVTTTTTTEVPDTSIIPPVSITVSEESTTTVPPVVVTVEPTFTG